MRHRSGLLERTTTWRLALAVALALAACTAPQQLLFSLLPDGTVPMLLSHFERLDDTNQRRISELEQRRDWAGLVKFAEENIAKDKANSDWWLVAGYAYSQLGERKQAIARYTEVVRLEPHDVLGWNLLAQSYQLTGQPERAVQIANRALNVRDDSPETWFILGESYSDLNRTELAAKAYRQAVRLEERYAQAWLGLGKAYKRLGRADEVKQIAQTLEKLNPALAQELRGK